MSKPSSNYLEKVERWILGGIDINKMIMKPEQRYRAVAAYEAYQIWLQDKQIRPMDIMRRIANREYPALLHKAEEGNPQAIEYVEALHIKRDVPRTITELSNDVAVFNHLVGRFDVAIDNIEKAKVQDASDWLITQGMKTGDARAVKSGADIKMQLHNNFQERNDAENQLPVTEINITGDVSVIKRDRINYSDEEKRRLARKYGMTDKEAAEMIETSDGTWQMAGEQEEEEKAPDFFEDSESEI